MSNKNKAKVDMKSIREYEKAQRSQVIKEDAVEAIGFDQWWADNSSNLKLAPYMKEIIRADFRGRGLDGLNENDKWNLAAKQFGLSI